MRLKKEDFPTSEANEANAVANVAKGQASASRRLFGHIALAGAVGAALVACGGGSDPTGVTDESSDDGPDLKKAYDRINGSMYYDDVVKVVGVVPNDIDTAQLVAWYYSSGILRVSFDNSDGDPRVSLKEYDPPNGPQISVKY